MREVVHASGHPNVRAAHYNTLEVTREAHLTPRGDCIIAVAADKGLLDFPDEFREALRGDDAILLIKIGCGGFVDEVRAHGHQRLILTHPTDMVVRKSSFICPRTLAVKADKAACDLDRKLVEGLKSGKPVTITLRLEGP